MHEIKIFRNRDSLSGIDKKDELIHLSFRPTLTDLKKIYEQSSVRLIQIPASLFETLSNEFFWVCCDLCKIRIAQGDFLGFRTDIQKITISAEEFEFMKICSNNKREWVDVKENLGNLFTNFSLSFIKQFYEIVSEKKK